MVLEVFHVSEEDSIRIDANRLRYTVEALFKSAGMPEHDAKIGTDCLLSADLRGVDSHGVSNMLRVYMQNINDGVINPAPNWKITNERLSIANIDCDRGLGIVIAPQAMEIAIEKAKKSGIGVVTMANGAHAGMVAYHAMLALKHDMIGMSMTAAGAQVLPTFGAEPRLGTNPIAIAAPANKERPFVFDAATSSVAVNKINLAKRMNVAIPGGLVAQADGTPILEESLVPDNYKLLPTGSTREQGSHKGYALACMVEILCSIMSGSGFGFSNERGRAQSYVAAYDVSAFTDVNEFKSTMDEFIKSLRETPPAPGQNEVVIPGHPEFDEEIERGQKGIPLHKEVIQWFDDICGELGINSIWK